MSEDVSGAFWRDCGGASMNEERRDLLLRRTQLGVVFAGIFAAAILAKVFVEQVPLRPARLALAEVIVPGQPPEQGEPGPIYSLDGELLAKSILRHAVCANPQAYENEAERARAATQLSEVTGARIQAFYPRLADRRSQFCYVARQVSPEVAAAVRKLDLKGVFLRPEYARVYPQGSLAANVIGRRGIDNVGLTGVENLWGFCLDGKSSSRRVNVDASGQTIVGADAAFVPAEPGSSLVLTLHLPLQKVVEAAMDDLVAKHRPVAATCTVLDPRNGDILAAAARPTFNPNDPRNAKPEDFLCRAATDVYEPGSTFKAPMIAAALDARAITTSSTFVCTGTTMVGGRRLSCWGEWGAKGHGVVTPAEIIAKSCNLGAAQSSLRLDRRTFYQYLEKMQILQYRAHDHMYVNLAGEEVHDVLSSGLDGEQPAYVPPREALRVRDQANVGFGQGVYLTDLHLLAAYGAIANGGTYYYPNIVREVRNAAGQLIRRREPLSGGRLFRPETCATMRSFLEGVVVHGTGAPAAIPGVRVGGKTGTAQIYDWRTGGFLPNEYIMSFIAVAPIDAPRFVVLCRVTRPAYGAHGSDTALPTVKRVLTAALRLADERAA